MITARRRLPLLATLALGGAMLGAAPAAEAEVPVPVQVSADAETVPTAHAGDSADDPAIWVNPTDPAQSLVIGNDKQGALEVYGLDGSRRQRITSSIADWGNVDVRQQVTVGSATMDLVVAANDTGLRIFRVDPATLKLRPVTDGLLPTGVRVEGLCLYDSAASGRLSAFAITRGGQVRQFLIGDANGDGLLEATQVRQFAVGSESEGCVADDVHGSLYVDQEDVGMWRYGAEPTDGTARTQVDAVQPAGHLAADAEGITLVDLGAGAGYLIASAQRGDDPTHSYFTVYDRQTNGYVGAFQIVNGTKADGCSRTDGVAAYAGDLGPDFPQGLFVCQDNSNRAPGTSGHQDFKLTRLERVVDLDGGGNASPSASFTAECSGLACSFDGTGSSDPDGTITSYAWDFGDGGTDAEPTTHHTFTSAGEHAVTLLVTDDDGATGQHTATVSAGEPPPAGSGIAYRGSADTSGRSVTSVSLQVPSSVQAGDGLVLLSSTNSAVRAAAPAGYSEVGDQTAASAMTTQVFAKVAGGGDAGSTVRVALSGPTKVTVQLVAYSGTDPTAPVGSVTGATDAGGTSHTTPTTSAPAGSWVLSAWSDKQPDPRQWTAPADTTVRSDLAGTGSGDIATLVADGGPVAAGPVGGLTATVPTPSTRATMLTIVLRP